MNLIDVFSKIAKKWNDEKKCSSCWTFGAPLSDNTMNLVRSEDGAECCTHLFITRYSTASKYEVKNNFVQTEFCEHSFTLYAVKHSDLGINVHSEEPEHEISESLWNTILAPLQKCLGCGNEIQLCAIGFPTAIITSWRMEPVINYQDSNYTGWKIMATLRDYHN